VLPDDVAGRIAVVAESLEVIVVSLRRQHVVGRVPHADRHVLVGAAIDEVEESTRARLLLARWRRDITPVAESRLDLPGAYVIGRHACVHACQPPPLI
jgi:hypothetical protein